MKIYVKKVEGVIVPSQGSSVSAGYDVVATSEPKIVGEESEWPDRWSNIDYIEYETNLYIAPLVVTTHTLIHPRSSISKYNLVLANSVGLVDSDYRGMVICRFKYVWQPEDFWVPELGKKLTGQINAHKIYRKGDKIAQLVFEPTVQAEFELVDDLQETKRGEGGFGSTDVGDTIKQATGERKVITSQNVKFDDGSTMAENFRKLHYVTNEQKKTYEQMVKEREAQLNK